MSSQKPSVRQVFLATCRLKGFELLIKSYLGFQRDLHFSTSNEAVTKSVLRIMNHEAAKKDLLESARVKGALINVDVMLTTAWTEMRTQFENGIRNGPNKSMGPDFDEVELNEVQHRAMMYKLMGQLDRFFKAPYCGVMDWELLEEKHYRWKCIMEKAIPESMPYHPKEADGWTNF